MVESDVLITDPELLSLIAAKKRRLKRKQEAAKRLKVIHKNIQPKKEGKRPRLRALKQSLDSVLTQIMGSTNPGVDLCLTTKHLLWKLNDIIEETLQAHRWLRRHGWQSPLDAVQIQAIDYISRRVIPEYIAGLDALTNKQESRQVVAEQSAELGKHMHAALTGRPPVGEKYWETGDEEAAG